MAKHDGAKRNQRRVNQMEEMVIPIKDIPETMERLEQAMQILHDKYEHPDLLEIRVKDIDSVPEVYYKGEPVYEGRLGSVSYLWEAGDYEEECTHNIDIKGASVEDASWDTISKHKMRGD